jgi:hypothetical protein
MKPANFNIEIAELVLHDFERVDGAELGASLRAELGRLLSRNGWPAERVEAASFTELIGGRLNLPANADARSIGHELAHQMYQGITGATTEASASVRPRPAAPGKAERSRES